MRGLSCGVLLVWALCGCSRSTKVDAEGTAVATQPSAALVAKASASAEEVVPPHEPGGLEVNLDGVYSPRPRPEFTHYALRFETRVFAEPNVESARVGQLRAGGGMVARGKIVAGKGCDGGFLPILPYGYVCKADLTEKVDHPFVLALGAHPPDPSQRLPYMYGTVKRGGPAYSRVPTADEVAQYEPNLKRHLDKWSTDEESGASYGLDLWLRGKDAGKIPSALDALAQKLSDPLPAFLQGSGGLPNPTTKVRTKGEVKVGEVSFRNGVAFVDTFLQDGRRFGVSTELEVLPVDRFRPIRGSEYHGIRIGDGDGQVQMPFLLVRRDGRKFKRVDKGHVKDAEVMPYRAALSTTGRQQFFDGVLHYETKDGLWADDRSVSRVDVAKKMPGWATAGEKWLDVNITKQVMVAYEGTTPVYATLVSTGEAGLADPDTTRSTTRGIFRIHTKYRSATMASAVSGEEFELRDVPYVQYFERGYALHAAYWHDVFGMPKSHGCINLAPEDARRIFAWTEPQVPSTWHGAALANKGTVLFVHP